MADGLVAAAGRVGARPPGATAGRCRGCGRDDAEKAGSGRPEALTAIAQRNGVRSDRRVGDCAAPRRQICRARYQLKRYRFGHLVDTQASSFEADPAESEAELLKRAAESIAAEIEGGAKRNAGAHSDQPASLAVTVPITTLGEWVQVRDRLTSVSGIRKIDLLSLSRQEARIEVKMLPAGSAEVQPGRGQPRSRRRRSGLANRSSGAASVR